MKENEKTKKRKTENETAPSGAMPEQARGFSI
jgi:hypothetical protein